MGSRVPRPLRADRRVLVIVGGRVLAAATRAHVAAGTSGASGTAPSAGTASQDLSRLTKLGRRQDRLELRMNVPLDLGNLLLLAFGQLELVGDERRQDVADLGTTAFHARRRATVRRTVGSSVVLEPAESASSARTGWRPIRCIVWRPAAAGARRTPRAVFERPVGTPAALRTPAVPAGTAHPAPAWEQLGAVENPVAVPVERPEGLCRVADLGLGQLSVVIRVEGHDEGRPHHQSSAVGSAARTEPGRSAWRRPVVRRTPGLGHGDGGRDQQ